MPAQFVHHLGDPRVRGEGVGLHRLVLEVLHRTGQAAQVATQLPRL